MLVPRLSARHGSAGPSAPAGIVVHARLERLRPEIEQRVAAMADALRDVLRAEPGLEAEELDTARREMLRVKGAP